MHPNSEEKEKMKVQNIKDICHIIRNTFERIKKVLYLNDIQVQQLIIAFTFLRRIDCMIGDYANESYQFYIEHRNKLSDKQLEKKLRELSGGYSFYIFSGYSFDGILYSSSPVDVAINTYLQDFSSNVQSILTDMRFQQNIAVLQRQSRYLVELLECYVELDLSVSLLNNKQFIELITELISNSSRNGGLFPTPIGLSKLICECLFCKEVCEGLVYDDPLDEISIYDPACGTGSLLAYAGEKAKSNYDEDVHLIGNEISELSCAVANAFILLTGDESSFANDVNTLTEEDSIDRGYKFVVGDLPLGLPWIPFKERIMRENMKGNGRFNKGLPSTADSQFLFIQEIVSKMDIFGGRAAFITSAAVLNGGSVKSGESRIRKWLIETGFVETIIALPKGVYAPYGNTPLFLWILTCNEFLTANEFMEKMDGKVRLIDSNRLISAKDKFTLSDEFITSVLLEYKSLENTEATRIVKKEDFGFYELELWDDDEVETVKISLDTDIKSFVEKERKPYAKGIIKIDYSSAEKGYSVDFSKFFESEESPIPSIESESSNILSVLDAIAALRIDIDTVILQSMDKPEFEVWRDLPLRAATEIINGSSSPRTTTKQGLPIISVANLRGETIEAKRYAITNKSKCVTSTDVILIKTGANAGEAFKGMEGILSSTLVAVRSTDESIIRPQFLYYLLKGYEKILRQMTGGYAIKSINTKAILDLKLKIPTIELQDKIVIFLNDIVGKIDNIIKLMDSSDNVFSQYRQTLIENAVRGKIRIN